MAMKTPPHPGLSVRHDCLDPLGLSVAEAAKRLDGIKHLYPSHSKTFGTFGFWSERGIA